MYKIQGYSPISRGEKTGSRTGLWGLRCGLESQTLIKSAVKLASLLENALAQSMDARTNSRLNCQALR